MIQTFESKHARHAKMPSHKKPYKIPTNLRKCRLRMGLNDDCLIAIFEYLEPKDLMNVSSMDLHFEKLTRIVVPRKWIFLKSIIHTRSSFFKKFGNEVRKLNISGAREPNEECKGKYTGMNADTTRWLNVQWLSKLRELHMTIQKKNDVLLFKQLSTAATNLKHLRLNINTHAIFLENEFPNLISLHINHRCLHIDVIQNWEIKIDEEAIKNHITRFVEKKIFLKQYEYNKEISQSICSIM